MQARCGMVAVELKLCDYFPGKYDGEVDGHNSRGKSQSTEKSVAIDIFQLTLANGKTEPSCKVSVHF